MDFILSVALLAGLAAALPSLLLLYYRDNIPPGVLWAAILCQLFMPVFGWFVAAYVALKDWDYPPLTREPGKDTTAP